MMSLRMLYPALVFTLIFALGCVGSESHWIDGKNSGENAKTNNDSNNTSANNGENASPNNNTFDAGTNADAGGEDSCEAYRYDAENRRLKRANCTGSFDASYECLCFDAVASAAVDAGSCAAALETGCGALPAEVGGCAVADDSCNVNSDGTYTCTCGEDPAAEVTAATCGDALWDACIGENDCSNAIDSCASVGPNSYLCDCSLYGEVAVATLLCSDALAACDPGVDVAGCGDWTGICAVDELTRELVCSCVDGTSAEADFLAECTDALAATCSTTTVAESATCSAEIEGVEARCEREYGTEMSFGCACYDDSGLIDGTESSVEAADCTSALPESCL